MACCTPTAETLRLCPPATNVSTSTYRFSSPKLPPLASSASLSTLPLPAPRAHCRKVGQHLQREQHIKLTIQHELAEIIGTRGTPCNAASRVDLAYRRIAEPLPACLSPQNDTKCRLPEWQVMVCLSIMQVSSMHSMKETLRHARPFR